MFSVPSCDPTSTTVALLLGGRSGERAISLASGKAVAKGLREEGFNVIEIDAGDADYFTPLKNSNADVVFICLHGKGGEDGCVQGVCEQMNLPYTGSGVLASALAMDKARSKTFYIASGLPTPHSVTVERKEKIDLDMIVAAVGEMSVVKPVTEGSALGVTIVHNPTELSKAIEHALEIDTLALIERFVEGVEVTVAVMGNDQLEAFPVIEIVPSNEFYDFEAKYAPGGSQHICPARIPDELAQSCQRISIAAHKTLGCRGFSRSDLIVDASGTAWLLETNTIPGMTSTSLLPDAALAVGIGFNKLCRLMVELALNDVKH